MKKIGAFLILVMFLMLLPNAYAGEKYILARAEATDKTPKEDRAKSFEGMEYFAGFTWGKLKQKPTYRLSEILVDFDFNLKSVLNLKISQLFQFQVEPFFGVSSQPRTDIETGTSFILKLGILPQTSKFQPFILGGVGLDYMTLHTREQGTQFNFNETLGFGAHYFFKKNSALTVEGRFRHLSNCGIEEPNSGINTCSVLVGLTRLF